MRDPLPPPPDPNEPWLELRLIAREAAGRDTCLYRLARADGGALPPAPAGAHITLALPDGMERQYSILEPGNAPRSYAIGVKREAAGRGGSRYMHDNLRVGDMVPVRTPRNHFPLMEGPHESLLIGGGIGITPMIAMARHLADAGRPYRLHAAFPSAGYRLFADVLAALPHVSEHLDDIAGGHFPLAAVVASADRDAHLYCCGPSPMIATFLAAAAADGRDDDHVHVEYFEAAAAPAVEGSFTVELAKSGLSLPVPPGRSILSVLEEAGVPVLSSCTEGICGACEVRVLEGIPDHRDAVLSPQEKRENRSIMVCCSGALTDRLVLDI